MYCTLQPVPNLSDFEMACACIAVAREEKIGTVSADQIAMEIYNRTGLNDTLVPSKGKLSITKEKVRKISHAISNIPDSCKDGMKYVDNAGVILSDNLNFTLPNGTVNYLDKFIASARSGWINKFRNCEWQSSRNSPRLTGIWPEVNSSLSKSHLNISGERLITLGASNRFFGVGREKRNYSFPYFVLDLDFALDVSVEVARDIVFNLEEDGVNLDHVYLFYSGGKSIHIYISSGILGNPVFTGYSPGLYCLHRLAKHLSPFHPVDKSLFSPLSVVRVPNTQHPYTGRYKIQIYINELDINSCLSLSKQPRKIRWNNPYKAPICHTLASELIDYKDDIDVIPSYDKVDMEPSIIRRIREGVAEGEEFDSRRGYIGRSKAMFLYSLYAIRVNETLDDAWIDTQNTNSNNAPPLNVNELKGRFKSALRTLSTKN